MFWPSLLNCGSARTFTYTYKSPGGPPLGPASPSLLIRNLLPLSTPAGIPTLSFLLALILPAPEQAVQEDSIISPSPSQVGHTVT
mmetsp:Transcript_34692/g.56164  ORF Transcript_34692/g.56164 Transcript_34692/m.56164 type:complete len:85 (+) Transcript_34692:348-602(+)